MPRINVYGGIFKRCRVLLANTKTPYEALQITRTASKAQVKTAYRQLAKKYHPDAEGGDAKKMEEINNAYKFLMKDGGYEQLQQRQKGAPHRRTVVRPFVDEAESGSGARASTGAPFSDEEIEKLGALDPGTERRTPSGKFLYQNRDDQSWVELDRPLVRANQPRYASYAAHADIVGELRRRQMAQEKEKNEKSSFRRNIDRLTDSADLPTRNPLFLRAYLVLLIFLVYMMISRTFARQRHQKRRNVFYNNVEDRRAGLLEFYESNKPLVEELTVAAALVYLAAARKKSDDDTPVGTRPVMVYDSVRPPASHFNVIAGG